MPTAHIEDIIDHAKLMQHLRQAMFTYQSHKREMQKVVDAGGIENFMTVEAAERIRDDHTQNMLEVEDMLMRLEDWYYGEYE